MDGRAQAAKDTTVSYMKVHAVQCDPQRVQQQLTSAALAPVAVCRRLSQNVSQSITMPMQVTRKKKAMMMMITMTMTMTDKWWWHPKSSKFTTFWLKIG